MKKTYLLLVILVVGVLYYFATYSCLVSGQEDVKSAIGKVQSAYQRRSDLIPNLVAVVKGYAVHENKTLTEVIKARQQVTEFKVDAGQLQNNPEAQKRFMTAQSELSNALSRLLVVSEQYPNLKADQQFLNLQAQIEGSENRINVERVRWQEAVNSYNKSVRGPLSHFIANMGGFTVMPYFEAKEGADIAPKVDFTSNN